LSKRYDYPITSRLIKAIKEEYRDEAIDKGDSWRKMESIEGFHTTDWLIQMKLAEEYTEITQLIERYSDFKLIPKGLLQSEILDLIEVACMIWERLEDDKKI
jgi:hypothetical protein